MKKNRIFRFLALSLPLILIMTYGAVVLPDNQNWPQSQLRDKITPLERKAAADIYDALVSAAQAAGTLVKPTLQVGADGYLIPDYFGDANWAYSPPMRKFIDAMPGLGEASQNALGQYIPIAVPDKVTFLGSDYYEIAVVEYEEQMHSNLPATTNRGYVQLSTAQVPGKHIPLSYLDGTPILKGDGTRAYAVDDPHYLGPAILSDSAYPVRIKFYNLLPIGTKGDLFIPVDTTVMGAGEGPDMNAGNYTENRSNIHLHGNNTIWISDGTPQQWITPSGEATSYPEGVSVVGVPDMPDVSDARDGTTTLYYTNAQSARLMFYHDHSYGITRLNVYAGEAAPFLIQDDVEKDLINGTNITGVNPLLKSYLPGVGTPLVIQDRTFVDAATIMSTDPTWVWGTNTYTPGVPYTPTTGDLWYPHVYMPAQNPFMSGGANPFGRWMYGPWFYPPTNIPFGLVANPYSTPNLDPADPNYRPPVMPGTPLVSAPGESFMDTPLVNGTAYPYLEVDPTAYRFRILNAANDRFFNLMFYVADDSYLPGDPGYLTEVKMIPSTTALPTHLEQIMPDPAYAGPDWIQIGTEGGFLPKPVVIPSQPTTWNLVGTAFNFGVVDQHSLLLGAAERADVIVDFSKFAGKTLILYNDAPAPYPANDPRYDYYTNNPDQTSMGGAPSTLAGFGPNTRTIMQIRVSGTVGEVLPAYDVDALMAVFAKGAIPATATTDANTGVFATDQEAIIVPQAAYNSAYGVDNLPADDNSAYVQLDESSKTFRPIDENGIMQTNSVTLPLEPKAMHDEMSGVYDEYGRMSGMLGLTSPIANSINAPFIAYGYASPPVDLLKATDADLSTTQIGTLPDGTQIWQITHNGVDTHPIHVHLFNGQLINRVAWDGALMPPDDNELGWKETFRVNPLEQIVIALRPKIPTAAQIPFDVPNSIRLLDPTMPEGAVLKEPPPEGWFTPGGIKLNQILNHYVNFGWEYVYHCHILSHEEMDMMHTMAVAVTPKAPGNLQVTRTGSGSTTANALTWQDNASNETSYLVQRSVTATGPWTTIATLPINSIAYSDPIGNTNNAYYYQVLAVNVVGDTLTAGFPTITETSPASNVILIGSLPVLKPAVPSSLTATMQTGPQVLLSWTDNAVNETGFAIRRSTDNGATYSTIATVGAATGTGLVTFTDDTVIAGQNYAYTVAAINSAGSSTYSNMARAMSLTLPAAPSNVSVTSSIISSRNGAAILTWVDNALNETGYIIERATNSTFTTNLVSITVSADTTSYNTGNITRFVPYYFRIKSVNSLGESAAVNASPFPIPIP